MSNGVWTQAHADVGAGTRAKPGHLGSRQAPEIRLKAGRLAGSGCHRPLRAPIKSRTLAPPVPPRAPESASKWRLKPGHWPQAGAEPPESPCGQGAWRHRWRPGQLAMEGGTGPIRSRTQAIKGWTSGRWGDA